MLTRWRVAARIGARVQGFKFKGGERCLPQAFGEGRVLNRGSRVWVLVKVFSRWVQADQVPVQTGKVGMQASRCMCRQAGARTGRQVPVHVGQVPMHVARCSCMQAGARTSGQVPAQAGRCLVLYLRVVYPPCELPQSFYIKNTSPVVWGPPLYYCFPGPGGCFGKSAHMC